MKEGPVPEAPRAIETPSEAAARFAREVAHVGSAVAHELMLRGTLEAVLDQSILTLGAEFAYVYLADEDQRTLELVAHRNLPDDFKERVSRVSFDAPALAARTASTRQAQMISSIDQFDPALTLTRELREWPAKPLSPCRSLSATGWLEC
jgi:GAF domain-containing protein